MNAAARLPFMQNMNAFLKVELLNIELVSGVVHKYWIGLSSDQYLPENNLLDGLVSCLKTLFRRNVIVSLTSCSLRSLYYCVGTVNQRVDWLLDSE